MHECITVNRDVEKQVRFLLGEFPIVAIVGSRQCGKTTVCRKIGLGWKFIDLEKESDHQLLRSDPELFLNKYPANVVIDEVQLLPKLFPALRVSVDEMRSVKGRFLITGSSSPNLMRNVSESLAGRIAVVELSPLKATERWESPVSALYGAIARGLDIVAIENISPAVSENQLWESWLSGGYPEPVLHMSKEAYTVWMENYRSSYINRDVRSLFPRLNLEAFRRFIAMLASLSGTTINNSDLSRSLAVSQPTVREYLEIAHGTFVWRTLPAYTRNVTRRVMKMPRGHLRDSGLLNYLLHIDNQEKLISHPNVGRLWESFVIEELLKGMHNAGIVHDAFYYRTGNGAEIDLVLEGAFGILPIEVKYGTTIDHRALRSIIDFVNERKLPLGIVINNSNETQWIHERILRVPATHI